MDKNSTNLTVPWFKIMHAGFNAGFRWTISSVVLGLLAFLMGNRITICLARPVLYLHLPI